ncbi:MAG TPA: hypothetical protein VK868_16180, partial [Pyrinomonadaceae bacterium]|nr:hypothetical protein [Pyrinomonadaceae bacterium]
HPHDAPLGHVDALATKGTKAQINFDELRVQAALHDESRICRIRRAKPVQLYAAVFGGPS